MNDLELVLFVFAVWFLSVVSILLIYRCVVRDVNAANERSRAAAVQRVSKRSSSSFDEGRSGDKLLQCNLSAALRAAARKP